MREAIANFHTQFEYQPEIINRENLKKRSNFIVVGMGGSALAPKLLDSWKPELNIYIHSDYGLPAGATKPRGSLIILSSYSGNTEEVIDAFHVAKKKKLDMAIVAAGGELLRLAMKNKMPYIQIPDTGIQPRMALGYSVKAFLKIFGEEAELNKLTRLEKILKPSVLEQHGKSLAKRLENSVPIVYASNKNASIAYNWKIKFNETGKIPAFYNLLPELNHNEMTGFDIKDSTMDLSKKFYFLFLKDPTENPKILKRLTVLQKLYKARNLNTEIIELKGKDFWHKAFSALVLCDWTAYYTSQNYHLESEQVPMVEEFKRLIKS